MSCDIISLVNLSTSMSSSRLINPYTFILSVHADKLYYTNPSNKSLIIFSFVEKLGNIPCQAIAREPLALLSFACDFYHIVLASLYILFSNPV